MSMKHSNLKNFIEELIKEVETELDEANVTGNIDGYQTPYAFSDGSSKDKNRKKKIATQLGYKLVDESLMSDLDLIKKGSKDVVDFIKKVISDSDFKDLRNDKEFHKYLKSFYNESVVTESKDDKQKVVDYLIKKGNNKNDAQKMVDKNYDYVSNKYKGASVSKKAEIISGLQESISESKVKRPVNRWLELKNDESMHANKKLAVGLKELKYQLAEVEKFFTWYNKIKTMNELDSSDYWKRTNNHIYKIKERILNIAKTIQEIEK